MQDSPNSSATTSQSIENVVYPINKTEFLL